MYFYWIETKTVALICEAVLSGAAYRNTSSVAVRYYLDMLNDCVANQDASTAMDAIPQLPDAKWPWFDVPQANNVNDVLAGAMIEFALLFDHDQMQMRMGHLFKVAIRLWWQDNSYKIVQVSIIF